MARTKSGQADGAAAAGAQAQVGRERGPAAFDVPCPYRGVLACQCCSDDGLQLRTVLFGHYLALQFIKLLTERANHGPDVIHDPRLGVVIGGLHG